MVAGGSRAQKYYSHASRIYDAHLDTHFTNAHVLTGLSPSTMLRRAVIEFEVMGCVVCVRKREREREKE